MQHADKCKYYIQSPPQTAATVLQYTKSKISTNHSTTEAGQATGAEEAPTGVGDPTRATGPDPGKTTDTVQHRCVEIVGEPHTTPDKSVGP